jgi:uncharacterized protein
MVDQQAAPPKPRRKRGWRYLRNILIGSVLVFFLVSYSVGWVFVSQEWAHPRRYAVSGFTPADMNLTYEDVTFLTDDGLILHGWYIPSQNSAAVILSHGMASNRIQVMRQANALAQAGFGALVFDLRAHGDSEGDTTNFNGDDVLAALHYLQSRDDVDPNRIGAFGFSLGGTVTLEAAAQDQNIQAVAADGPGGMAFVDMPPPVTVGEWLYAPFDLLFFHVLSLRTGRPSPPALMDVVDTIAPRPILFIAASGEESRTVRRFYEAAGERKTFWEIPGIGHGEGFEAFPDEYAERIVTFFRDSLE